MPAPLIDSAVRLIPSLLYCSFHSYADPASGAAVSGRDLLTLLAGRGWYCRVLCGPQHDAAGAASLPSRLQAQGLRWRCQPWGSDAGAAALLHFQLDGIPVTALSAPALPSPPPELAEQFLACYEQCLYDQRPDVVLTYGGGGLGRAIIALARRRGIPVIFWLRNLDYAAADLFAGVSSIIVPSQFLAGYYRQKLGLDAVALPPPLDGLRVYCANQHRRFVTFVNPQAGKGAFVFARIAFELGRRRPDIPFLVVESRGTATWLDQVSLDLEAAGNIHVMENTPDPRDFYQVSRLVLMPSLWEEPFGRVAAEACVNGIPVLASRRGGLPEALAEAGLLLDVPPRCTADFRLVPMAAEVEPWIQTIIRLWDDPAAYEAERQRSLAAAAARQPERLGPAYEAVLWQAMQAPRPSLILNGSAYLPEIDVPWDVEWPDEALASPSVAVPRPPSPIRPWKAKRRHLPPGFSISFSPWGQS